MYPIMNPYEVTIFLITRRMLALWGGGSLEDILHIHIIVTEILPTDSLVGALPPIRVIMLELQLPCKYACTTAMMQKIQIFHNDNIYSFSALHVANYIPFPRALSTLYLSDFPLPPVFTKNYIRSVHTCSLPNYRLLGPFYSSNHSIYIVWHLCSSKVEVALAVQIASCYILFFLGIIIYMWLHLLHKKLLL